MSEAIEKVDVGSDAKVAADNKPASKAKSSTKAKVASKADLDVVATTDEKATDAPEGKNGAAAKATPKTPAERANTQRRNARRRRQMSVKELSGTRVSTRLNAVSLRSQIADDVPSMEVSFKYSTSFMHKFMAERGETLMQVAERLAAAMRMLSQDPELYNDFEKWSKDSLKEAKDSIKTLREQREVLEQTLRKSQRDLQVNTPDKYVAKFVFTTGIGRQVVELLEDVDAELAKAQYLYFAGALNDLQLSEANRQGLSIINSYIDRAFKITSPGKRESGQFQSSALAEHMRTEKNNSANQEKNAVEA